MYEMQVFILIQFSHACVYVYKASWLKEKIISESKEKPGSFFSLESLKYFKQGFVLIEMKISEI